MKRNESNHIYIKYRKHSRVCTINGKGIESSSTQLKEVRDKNTIPQRIPLFTLQGNFDVQKLHGVYRFMMNVMVKLLERDWQIKSTVHPKRMIC